MALSKKQVVMDRFHLHDDWALCVEATFFDGEYSHEKAVWMYNAMRAGALPQVVEKFINAKYDEEPILFV